MFILKPSVGTVAWVDGGKILAAASPGRKPLAILLATGEKVHYETYLRLPHGKAPTAARVNLGEHYGDLLCLPDRLVENRGQMHKSSVTVYTYPGSGKLKAPNAKRKE